MRVFMLWLILAASAVPAASQGLPQTVPEAVGLSSSRLQRLDAVMQGIRGQAPCVGIVTILVRNGRVAELAAYRTTRHRGHAPMEKHDLPHRVEDKGRYQCRGHDAGRGGTARPQRSGRDVHSLLQEDDGHRRAAGRAIPDSR